MEQNFNVTREQMVDLLNDDLAREYQAIIAYVVYSQLLKGAAYTDIARELEQHASEELSHALQISKQIDYLGGTPITTPKPVKLSEKPEELLRFDLENERETVAHYRVRIRQAEAMGELRSAKRFAKSSLRNRSTKLILRTRSASMCRSRRSSEATSEAAASDC